MKRFSVGLLAVAFGVTVAGCGDAVGPGGAGGTGTGGSGGSYPCVENPDSCPADEYLYCSDSAAPCEVPDCRCVSRYLCRPGEVSCADDSSLKICNRLGTDYEAYGDCDRTEQCVDGACVALCELADVDLTHVGCSFFALDVDSLDDSSSDGLLVVNSQAVTATVSLYGSPGGVETLVESDVQIPPLSSHAFILPAGGNIESVSELSTGGGFRIESDVPVTVHHHAPLLPSSDDEASLVLPEATLGVDYLAAAARETNGGQYPSYVDVVATEDGTTVSFVPPVATRAGAGVMALAAGETGSVTMNRYDTLQIVAAGSGDMTGTSIHATARIAVLGGVECANVPAGVNFCGHMEEQALPTRIFGLEYVGAHAPTRNSEKYYFTLIARDGDTTLTSDPPLAGLPITLAAGEAHELVTTGSAVFHGDKPFMAVQYLESQEGGAGFGDPASVTLIPPNRFLSQYAVVVPPGYLANYLQITRALHADVLVDGVVVPEIEYEEVATFTVANHEVTDGVHVVESALPFGVTVFGYGASSAFAHPAGLSLAP